MVMALFQDGAMHMLGSLINLVAKLEVQKGIKLIVI